MLHALPPLRERGESRERVRGTSPVRSPKRLSLSLPSLGQGQQAQSLLHSNSNCPPVMQRAKYTRRLATLKVAAKQAGSEGVTLFPTFSTRALNSSSSSSSPDIVDVPGRLGACLLRRISYGVRNRFRAYLIYYGLNTDREGCVTSTHTPLNLTYQYQSPTLSSF